MPADRSDEAYDLFLHIELRIMHLRMQWKVEACLRPDVVGNYANFGCHSATLGLFEMISGSVFGVWGTNEWAAQRCYFLYLRRRLGQCWTVAPSLSGLEARALAIIGKNIHRRSWY
jgi:hypothetical protein